MRGWAGTVAVLLLAGCRGGPDESFDAGQSVHVIVFAERVRPEGITIRPSLTLRAERVDATERRLGGGAPLACEVALFGRVPRGTHALAFVEPRTGRRGTDEIDVEGETWVVVELRASSKDVRIRAYDRPPHDEVGAWQPLVPVPD